MAPARTVKPRALRADAERNRRRVLEVGHRVFASEGLAVPIDEVARRAGLGVGTLYRHFPTKEALIAAIVVSKIEEVTAEARGLLESEKPSETLFAFLVRMIEGWSQKKDFMEALASAGIDLKEVARAKAELHAELGKLLEIAQAAGGVRRDISIREIIALIAGTFGSLERHGLSAKERDRMLAVVFDGLRPVRASRSEGGSRRRAAK
jgi:AcrR family transcriptional regulator